MLLIGKVIFSLPYQHLDFREKHLKWLFKTPYLPYVMGNDLKIYQLFIPSLLNCCIDQNVYLLNTERNILGGNFVWF